jgi:hypothetical protein
VNNKFEGMWKELWNAIPHVYRETGHIHEYLIQGSLCPRGGSQVKVLLLDPTFSVAKSYCLTQLSQ